MELNKHKYYDRLDVNITKYVKVNPWLDTAIVTESGDGSLEYRGAEPGTLEFLQISAFECLRKFLTPGGVELLRDDIYPKNTFSNHLIISSDRSKDTLSIDFNSSGKEVRLTTGDFILIGIQQFRKYLSKQVSAAINGNSGELLDILKKCKSIITLSYKNGLKELCPSLESEIFRLMTQITERSDHIASNYKYRYSELTSTKNFIEGKVIDFGFNGSTEFLIALFFDLEFNNNEVAIIDYSPTELVELLSNPIDPGSNSLKIKFNCSTGAAAFLLKSLEEKGYFKNFDFKTIEKSKLFLSKSKLLKYNNLKERLKEFESNLDNRKGIKKGYKHQEFKSELEVLFRKYPISA